mmetsp:Transcript_70463/g.206140  ORF Transcript_70463/g.206140 Transcript_70463/m.206140 type:complete len:231 (-) Transcript_70463:56-748(-)
MAAVARRSIVTFVSATTVEKACRLFRTLPSRGVKPPATKDMPKTRRRLDRTLPRSVPLTTSIWPARMVWTIKIISTALPNVAFSKPPTVSLFRPAASSSVASPMSLARGIIARKFSQKVQTLLHSRSEAATATGQAIRRAEMGSRRIRCLKPSKLLGLCFQPRGCGESSSSLLDLCFESSCFALVRALFQSTCCLTDVSLFQLATAMVWDLSGLSGLSIPALAQRLRSLR